VREQFTKKIDLGEPTQAEKLDGYKKEDF